MKYSAAQKPNVVVAATKATTTTQHTQMTKPRNCGISAEFIPK